MTDKNEGQVTLDDVATDRKRFAEAHAHMKGRAYFEWLVGGLLFAATFSVAIWFLRPNVPTATYIIFIGISFFVSGFAAFMNTQKTKEWYRAKAAELDSVENRIRAGERVPRPNHLPQPTANRSAAEHRS